MMEVKELTKRIEEFLELSYQAQIYERIRKRRNHMVIDFRTLSEYCPDIAMDLLEKPEEVIDCFTLVIDKVYNPEVKITPRFSDITKAYNVRINSLRGSKYMDKLINVVGTIHSKSELKTLVVKSRYECGGCANIVIVFEDYGGKIKKPRCKCGRKNGFKKLNKEYIDALSIVLEELPENTDNELRTMYVLLRKDLLDNHLESKLTRGKRIGVNGVLKNLIKSENIEVEVFLDANYIDFIEEDFLSSEQLNEVELKQIKKLINRKKLLNYLSKEIFKPIYGHEEVKKGLTLQLFGGVGAEYKTGRSRGDIHILLIGDPGTSKSTFLKIVQNVAPKTRYEVGSGVSYAGLLAGAERDELLGGYTLRAGSFVLAHLGIVCLDELDKVHPEVMKGLHEALEQQEVSLGKMAKGTLPAKVSLLAGANPKHGRFSLMDDLYSQVNLNPTIVSRFDLIFPILDDKEKDKEIANTIMSRYYEPENVTSKIDIKLIKKYINHAKKFMPKISKEIGQYIATRYVDLRNNIAETTNLLDARALEAIARCATACARIHLRDVTMEDTDEAIEIILYSLKKMCYDANSNSYDLNKITTGVTLSKATMLRKINALARELFEEKGELLELDLLGESKERNFVTYEGEFEEAMEKLLRAGDIIRPRKGYIKPIN